MGFQHFEATRKGSTLLSTSLIYAASGRIQSIQLVPAAGHHAQKTIQSNFISIRPSPG